MDVQKSDTDSHGQSKAGFAFCHLPGFSLLPRLKAAALQKPYLPEVGSASHYPHLSEILTRPVKWNLIRQQHDEIIRYATALRLRTAKAKAILRRFSRGNQQHPTYQELAEPGLRQYFDDTTCASEKTWRNKMKVADLRTLSPLIYSHVNPYDRFGQTTFY